jgi:Flp pilus assembly protein TadD
MQVTPDRVNRALLNAAAARPYSSQPWSSAGDYYFSIGDLDQADVLYAEAVKRAPKRASLYAQRARIALLRGDRAGAETLLKKASSLFPNHPGYRNLQ